ncbi:hypothetical protein HN924_01920 [Candidatus Woesearchaeota archaeon]|jgi:hypothetical protein|nr:hypothetical protein [Candidatus Woesearchaeota archaeon]MBT7062705.1 hypothetical protein [Candidatus Woesearchaeota archaeon]MBT7402462.1 hypothetical protein [Candidatus Woesearchaeota archaeon]
MDKISTIDDNPEIKTITLRLYRRKNRYNPEAEILTDGQLVCPTCKENLKEINVGILDTNGIMLSEYFSKEALSNLPSVGVCFPCNPRKLYITFK